MKGRGCLFTRILSMGLLKEAAPADQKLARRLDYHEAMADYLV